MARRTTPAQHLRRRKKQGRKLGLPFIEVDDLLDGEPLDVMEGNVKEGIPEEAGEAIDENGNFSSGKNANNYDKENAANGEDEEVIEVKGAIFSLTGGGFTGAATSIRTQLMLRNLLKTRKAATKMAAIVEQSPSGDTNAFQNGGKISEAASGAQRSFGGQNGMNWFQFRNSEIISHVQFFAKKKSPRHLFRQKCLLQLTLNRELFINHFYHLVIFAVDLSGQDFRFLRK